jgi:hypothetical protein
VPRFLCDEMLHGLGRWLRAAGYETVIAKGGMLRPPRVLPRSRWLRERASTKPHEPCAPLLILTGSTRRSAGVLSTTGRLRRRRLIWRRRCRKGHAPPAAHCGCAPNAAAFTGLQAMSVECNSGLLRGNRKRPRLVNEPVWVRSVGVAAGSQRHKCVVAVSPLKIAASAFRKTPVTSRFRLPG